MSDIALDFGDAVSRTAHDLASMKGVDLVQASPAVVRLWEARGLALHHLAEGSMDEALKVMAAATGRRIARNPEPIQPPSAAKETP